VQDIIQEIKEEQVKVAERRTTMEMVKPRLAVSNTSDFQVVAVSNTSDFQVVAVSNTSKYQYGRSE
jgi:hypothetical protein